MDRFDYVIVGAGTAGCVLADRLSASGEYQVLVIEAGPRDRSPWIHIPIGYGKTMFDSRYNWGFYTEPEAQLNGRKVYCHQNNARAQRNGLRGAPRPRKFLQLRSLILAQLDRRIRPHMHVRLR